MLRSYSPEVLNYFLNHSKVYNNITQDSDPVYLDGSELLKKPDTHFLTFEDGALLFFATHEGVYKGDIYFLKTKNARACAIEALKYMFVFAERIVVEAPSFNKRSMHFISGLGFRRTAVNPQSWLKDGKWYDVISYEMDKVNGKYR